MNGYTVSAAATRAIGASNERIARSANSAATCAPTPAWRCASEQLLHDQFFLLMQLMYQCQLVELYVSR